MEDFSVYLQKQGYCKAVILGTKQHVRHYLAWLEAHHIALEEVRYKDLMNYIGQLQAEAKPAAQQNKTLRAIEKYYDYKQVSLLCKGVRIKTHKPALKPLLEAVELEAVYQHYAPKSEVDELLLSLLIYQALERKDILRIERKEVELQRGRLYIKSRGKKQARYLKLESHQVMQLYNYMAATKAEREHVQQGLLIFIPDGADPTIRRIWKNLNRDVTEQAHLKLNITVQDLQHLRQSRLYLWITQYGLRQAQYGAGFKSVKGIEYYQTRSLKDLQHQLEQCHPLK